MRRERSRAQRNAVQDALNWRRKAPSSSTRLGEFPPETQVALLRVLQEHEFQRIGGSGPVRTDVRVIAATNRDLESAIAAGTFRSDLFYRLNVFPIELPPLRGAKRRHSPAGHVLPKSLRTESRKEFYVNGQEEPRSAVFYAWPGNIRELQNVIERSVIVSESQTFSVDESWLSRPAPSRGLDIRPNPLSGVIAQEEKAIIETALRECGGRVYGPSGAADKLGIPRPLSNRRSSH